jgi:hypothetical protein
VDLEAAGYRRMTLYCQGCSRRIAWATVRDAVLHSGGAWRWQGKRVPIHYRTDGDVPVVDLECFSCGWTRTAPVLDVPYAANVLHGPDILAREIRRQEAL